MSTVVSVIVPVYNAEARLHLCVESILNQNFHDFELILVDDGSKDNSGRICDELAKKDERIRVIHKTNGGVSSARNAGLAQSAGDWIVFVDSDDMINDTFLEDHYALIQRNEADLSISGLQMETWDEGKIVSLEYHGGKDQLYTVKELLDAKEIDYPTICISGPWCKMYRASIIRNEHLQFDETMALGEDSCFVHAFLEHVKTVVFSSKFHYRYYRGNGDSLFSKYHDNFFENYSQYCAQILKTMETVGCGQDTITKEKNRSLRLLMGSVKKEYQFYQRSSRSKRRAVMKKVANHPLVVHSRVTDYTAGYDALVCFSVQHRWYLMAECLLQLKRILRR